MRHKHSGSQCRSRFRAGRSPDVSRRTQASVPHREPRQGRVEQKYIFKRFLLPERQNPRRYRSRKYRPSGRKKGPGLRRSDKLLRSLPPFSGDGGRVSPLLPSAEGAACFLRSDHAARAADRGKPPYDRSRGDCFHEGSRNPYQYLPGRSGRRQGAG